VTVVDTTSGRVRGQRIGAVVRFLGIPYAGDVSGANRFRPPPPPTAWRGIHQATAFGCWAPQEPDCGGMGGRPGPQAECCLTVNVWTPGADDGGRPVMAWLHGGGFLSGSGADQVCDWGWLAAQGNIIVVTCNYRLGILGFAAHEQLSDEESGAAGNWGLLDQVAALRWVAANIAAFGGDPDRVTVAGQSAGAMSICDLLAMPAAAGLFARAIALSGAPSARSMEQAARTLEWVTARLGAGKPAQLRELPAAALLRAQRDLAAAGDRFAMRPVVDGAVIGEHPLDAAAAGRTAPVPMVIGNTHDEVRHFYAGSPVLKRMTERALRARISRAIGGTRAAAVIDAYRAARTTRGADISPGELFVAIEGDRTLRVPAMLFAERLAGAGSATYAYRFDFVGGDPRWGARHGLDMLMAFGDRDSRDITRWINWTPEADRLAWLIRTACLVWIHGASPGHPALGDWPTYDAHHRTTMIFAQPCRTVDAPREAERSVWRQEEVRI
jgi:para-nitrobenzyl esterase